MNSTTEPKTRLIEKIVLNTTYDTLDEMIDLEELMNNDFSSDDLFSEETYTDDDIYENEFLGDDLFEESLHDEMDVTLTLHDMISSGYFPKELPAFFTTKNLGRISNDIEEKLGEFNKHHKVSKSIIFSMPKSKNTRRVMSIPNPHHQINLCKTIVDNWNELETHFAHSRYTLTSPKIGFQNRAVAPEFPFNEITRQRIIKSTASSYLLKTDISRYYSTIYTHSIPWALYDKKYAKDNRNNHDLMGNKIDFYVRNTRDQQTLGIPIGPDTSLVISEILGTKIDMLLDEKIPNAKGFRYIDDIYMYFKDLSEAEEAKYLIHGIFAEFELEMNEEKTEIIKLHNEIEPEWIFELRTHNINYQSEKDLISFFSKTFKFHEQYPKDSVTKYAIRKLKNANIDTRLWEVYEAFLMKSCLNDASCMSDVLDIVLSNISDVSLDYDLIGETISYIVERGIKYQHSFEIIWGLWFVIVLELEIPESVQLKLSSFNDPMVTLMLLYCNENGIIIKEYDKSTVKDRMRSDDLYGANWILTYEAYVRNWSDSKSGKDILKNKKFFNLLRNLDVFFTLSYEEVEQYLTEKMMQINLEKQNSQSITSVSVY